MSEKKITLTKCIECPHHSVIGDPDPNDSFCYDDEAIVCTKTEKDESEINFNSSYAVDWQKFRAADSGCRPYQIKNVKIPDWCPL